MLSSVPRVRYNPSIKCLLLKNVTYLQSDPTVLPLPTLSLPAGALFHLIPPLTASESLRETRPGPTIAKKGTDTY